jgi:hypothetical protein
MEAPLFQMSMKELRKTREKPSIMTDGIHTTSEYLAERKLALKIRYCCNCD